MPGVGQPPEGGFYTGGGLSADVPHLFPVAIDGIAYQLDMKQIGVFKRNSIQLLRNQADTSNIPGESSINPEDLWRRGQKSWHQGAGQQYLDQEESSPNRFRVSKGIDVWEKWQISLLPDTERKTASANVNQSLVAVGNRLYWGDGTTLKYTLDPSVAAPVWVTVTGTSAQIIQALASDGHTVYIANGTGGIFKTDKSTGAAAAWATGNVSLVGYVKGRVMAAYQNMIYNVTAGGALPGALFTHPNTDFKWVGFAEGRGHLYAAGYSGDKSLIYRTAVRPDGTALDIPVVAGELPDGEIVRSVQGYLGFLLIGTDVGVRFALPDGNGDLNIGALIRIGKPVLCFEPQDRFCWFGWTNYDATSTGLGRLDLSQFIQPLTPAHASDLMSTAQGDVLNVVTFGERRYWVVSGSGIWGQTINRVPSGTLDSGLVTFGIPDAKVAMSVQARHRVLSGRVRIGISVDGGAFQEVGSNSTPGSKDTTLPTNQVTGETFEIRTILERDAVMTLGPIVTRHTLRTYPGPNRGHIFMVPLLLHEALVVKGQERHINPEERLNRIIRLVQEHRLVPYQEAMSSWAVFVEDYEWMPSSETLDGKFWNGTCVVKLKAVAE